MRSPCPQGDDSRVTVSTAVAHGDDTALNAGDVIADRFHVRRFIAFGGMGEVYEAEDGSPA